MYCEKKYKATQKILWIILVLNFLVAAIKIIFGQITGSSSLTADGFHSLTDGSSNVVGLIAIALASKPVDKEHPYGHSKYETLASLFIGIMLVILGLKVMGEAAGKFVNPTSINVSIQSIIAIIFTLAINIYVSAYEFRMGKVLKSEILISDSFHTRGDIFVSLGVLTALISIKLGVSIMIDPIVSLIVGVFIFKAAYDVLHTSAEILVDTAVVDSTEIREIVMKQNGVFDVYNIRSRGNTEDMFIDMNIVMNSSFNVSETHELSHKIEKSIRDRLKNEAQVIIHVEPYEG